MIVPLRDAAGRHFLIEILRAARSPQGVVRENALQQRAGGCTMDRSRSRGAGSQRLRRKGRDRFSFSRGRMLQFETLEERYAPNVLIAGGDDSTLKRIRMKDKP
jgi:hypothetical protein